MTRLLTWALLGMMIPAGLSSVTARAEDSNYFIEDMMGSPTRPGRSDWRCWDSADLNCMIEAGGGVESAILDRGLNVLLRLNGALTRNVGEDPEGDFPREQFIIAHISGDVAISTDPDTGHRVPYMDIRFIPVHNVTPLNEEGRTVMIVGDFQFLPMDFERDQRLDIDGQFEINVVGAAFDFGWQLSDKVSLLTRLAVDLLGYKYLNHTAEERGDYHGIHIADAVAEAGLRFDISRDFVMQIKLGFEGDFSFGWTGGDGAVPSVNSDGGVYAEIGARIYQRVSVLLRGGVNYMAEGAAGGAAHWSPQVMLSVAYRF